MFRYISSFSVNTLHSVVNCGLLRMLVMVRPQADILVEATSSSAGALQSAVSDLRPDVKFHKLAVNSKKGRMAMLLRYIQSFFFNIRALCNSRGGDTLIYNFNNVFSLSVLNFLSRKLFKNRKILIVCHGEMEYLVNSHKHHQVYKHLMAFLTKNFFLNTNPSKLSPDLNFIVLGDSILRELKDILPAHFMQRIHSIDHPVMNSHVAVENHRNLQGKIRVGTVGILNRYKGLDSFMRVVKYFRDKGNHKLEFSAVGHIQSDLDALRSLGVKVPTNPEEAIPEEEFTRMVSELDFILLFYPSDNYRLIASGALLDTVRFNKPLIAISTSYFRYFFEKFGPVGYLVNDEVEMIRMLERIQARPWGQFDFESPLSELSTEKLAPRFGQILSDI